MKKVWRTGDPVKVTFQGRKVVGRVKLASPNGRSLMLEFEAVLGGYVGMMPVTADKDDDEFRDLMTRQVVTLEDPK